MKIYCGKCGGAYDDQFVVCPHCGNIREEQQANYIVEEIKSEPPKSKKKTPKWVKITAVVVAVVIVLTGVLWSTGTLSNIMPVQAGYVRVPSVIGKSREKAKEILMKKKLGLLIIGKMDTDDDMELGLVCEQSPGKGDKAKENADVSVMLSNGPKMGYMPAMVYYKVDTATANIEAQGLKAEVKYEYSDEVGKDGVISQSVETNTAVKQGETVTITVSKGSKNESEGTVKMKNLVGMDFETARKELLKDGIYLLVEDAKYDENAPENQIIVQNDKEGSEIQKGENVFVTISLGKEKVRVPDLVYLEKAEAEGKLKELGFTVKTETGSDENTADGLVLEQSAPSGEMLEKGSEITITVNDRPTTATDGEEEIEFLEATEDEIRNIENDEVVWGYCGDFDEVNYDCETDDMEMVLSNFIIIDGCGINFQEYIEVLRPENGKEPDPRKCFAQVFDNQVYYYYEYASASQVDWVAKNIFNVKSTDFNEHKRYYDNDGEEVEVLSSYKYGDYYYAEAPAKGFIPQYDYKVSSYNRLPDGKYEILLDRVKSEYASDLSTEKKNASKIIAGLKNIDGKRVWSYYKIVGNP